MLENVIKDLVQAEMARLLGQFAKQASPGAVVHVSAPEFVTGATPRPRKPRPAPEGAPVFAVGDMVTYRQGKGVFPARVISIEDGAVEVERDGDRKRVLRPPHKLTPQVAEPAA